MLNQKKSLKFKKFYGNVDSVYYDDVDNYDDADDDEKYRKIGSIGRLFEGFDRDYYKQLKLTIVLMVKK